jgi:hypothetical protein
MLYVVLAAAAFAPSAYAQGKPAPKPGDKPAATAPAGDKKDDPKAKYAGAVKKFNDKDFAGALSDFQDLDALKSTPQSQNYIAQCLDKLGRYGEAAQWYDKLIANPGKMTKEAEDAKKRVEEIKKMPAKLHVETTPSGATIMVDGKAAGSSPADVDLTPGKHLIHIEVAGYEPIDKDVDAAYGAKVDVRTQLEKKAEPVAQTNPNPPPPVVENQPPPPPPPPAKPKSKLPAIITGGLAVVALGFGTGFGIAALGNKSDFDKNPTQSTADAAENNALVADMMFGVAITLGVTSAVLFFTKDEEDKPKAARLVPKAPKDTKVTITPAPIITPHGGGAGAMVRF